MSYLSLFFHDFVKMFVFSIAGSVLEMHGYILGRKIKKSITRDPSYSGIILEVKSRRIKMKKIQLSQTLNNFSKGNFFFR